MNLIKCDDLKVIPNRLYGGATGSKIAVEYSDSVWILKCGESLRTKGFRNVEISYANDPITEYIGSHIYEIFGFPVHETLLGTYYDRMCVLCTDNAYPNHLFEFKEFRNAIFDDTVVQASSGMSTHLSDIIQVINKSDRIPTEKAIVRFWQMFVLDALIGNTDRNNGNWGFVFENGEFELYDVYDCGGCLNNKRSDEQMQHDLDADAIKHLALNYTFNFKNENGKRINPFHYIEKNPNPVIKQTLELFTEDRLEDIYVLIDSLIPVISSVRAIWYKEIIRLRFAHLVQLQEKLKGSIGQITAF